MRNHVKIRRIWGIAALCSFAGIDATEAQVISGIKFEVLTKDNVGYNVDSTPPANYGTAQGRTPINGRGPNFLPYLTIADVVSVNGRPAKGVQLTRGNDIRLSSNRANPPNGRAISDVNGRNTIDDQFIELLQPDGSAVGTLMLLGSYAGPAPPGVPASWGTGNYAIVGGTGAFLGARGFCGWFRASNTPFVGNASIAEDPLGRRERGGDDYLIRCNLIPMSVPEIVNVWHADFSPVTAAKPARADEILIASVRGLGPTRPGIEPGMPFPESPIQTVNSPIEMTAGGQSVELMNQIGWPGQENLYRLDFRMPKIDASPTAALRITAAWMPGPAYSIPVQ
jgi:hypothetical protein